MTDDELRPTSGPVATGVGESVVMETFFKQRFSSSVPHTQLNSPT